MKRLFADPMTYVIGLGLAGPTAIVIGVGIVAGVGYSAIVSGIFMLAGAWFITHGMKTDG